MPAPNPFGIDYDETADGHPMVTGELWPSNGLFAGNRRHRLARMRAVLGNLSRGGWCCPECGDPVPICRRADAVYCSRGCRKRAMRARSSAKAGVEGSSFD